MKHLAPYLPYIYLTMAVAAEVVGTTALKASMSFTKLVPTIIMIAAYMVAFFFLSFVMRTLPVGITYALWSALGIVLITIASIYLFDEVLDLAAVIGIAMIIGGIVVIQLFSKMNLSG